MTKVRQVKSCVAAHPSANPSEWADSLARDSYAREDRRECNPARPALEKTLLPGLSSTDQVSGNQSGGTHAHARRPHSLLPRPADLTTPLLWSADSVHHPNRCSEILIQQKRLGSNSAMERRKLPQTLYRFTAIPQAPTTRYVKKLF